MCKWSKYGDTRIDPCMRILIQNINELSYSKEIQTVACCCGHGKYPMTILLKIDGRVFDIVSGKEIPRTRRFYKKDKDGVYYIPETIRTPPKRWKI